MSKALKNHKTDPDVQLLTNIYLARLNILRSIVDEMGLSMDITIPDNYEILPKRPGDPTAAGNKINLQKNMDKLLNYDTTKGQEFNFDELMLQRPEDFINMKNSVGANEENPSLVEDLTIAESIAMYMSISGEWMKVVERMGKWYMENVHTYQQSTPPAKGSGARKLYDCPNMDPMPKDWKVGDDCSGFVSACLQLYGAFEPNYIISSAIFCQETGDSAQKLKDAGFEHISIDGNKSKSKNYSEMKPGDIIVTNFGEEHHVEIFWDEKEGKSQSWGSVHDGRSYPGKKCAEMPAYYAAQHYEHVWRLKDNPPKLQIPKSGDTKK